MRIALIVLQLGVLGALYLLVVVPVMAAAITALVGAAYMVVTAPGEALGLAVYGVLVAILHNLMVYLGYSTALTASLPGIVTFFLVAVLPWLIAVLSNLLCGFLAYYGTLYKKTRRFGLVVNALVLLYYLVPLVLAAAVSTNDPGSEMMAILCLIVAAPVLGYFGVCIFLLYRMPERPDLVLCVRAMPPVHFLIWGFLAIGCALGVRLADAGWIAASIVCAVVLLASVPFLVNARITRGMGGREGRPVYVWSVFVLGMLLALVNLILLPPVGVALALSSALLFFLIEMTYLLNRRHRPEIVEPA